jgi:uncharacterized protein
MHPRAFNVLTKPTGPICNLDCKYCFYLEKETLYPNADEWALSSDLLESFIKQYIEAQETDVVSFTWQGGEPTILHVDYFKRVVDLEKKYANGKRIENAFQTNGVLLNDEWGKFLGDNNFLVGLSIDGPRQLHDAYRVDKAGRQSFDRVMRGLNVLKRHNVAFNTLTTVHRGNADQPLEVYNFLKEIGSQYQQFIPIVERISDAPTPDGLTLVSSDFEAQAHVTEWSVTPRQFGRFLCSIFDEWICNDIGKTFVQLFDISLEMWVGLPASLCIFSRSCGAAMALEHNGDLYSCDHFVYPENRLGSIMDTPLATMAASSQQERFGANKEALLPRHCRECEVLFACNGECPKHRFMQTPDGTPGLNYLCAAYKKFFTHIDPYMRFMAMEFNQQRAPANVMAFARASKQGKGIKQNAPCPCGSGKKFKHCCAEVWTAGF